MNVRIPKNRAQLNQHLHARLSANFLRKNLVKPSDIPLRSSRIIALVNGAMAWRVDKSLYTVEDKLRKSNRGFRWIIN